MKKEIYRPFFDKNTNVLDFVRYNTIGKNKKGYFDYTASGLAFRPIETRIRDVLETYANIHSKESSNANITNEYYDKAIKSLYKNLEINNNFVVIPSGCGSTIAIKKFQELLGLHIPPATKKRYNINIPKEKMPLVIIGPYEHHSNEISYREAFCEIKRINLTKEGLVDLKQLQKVLKANSHREIIGSFSTASNVTGILTCYKKISKILRKYNALVCFDAAASSAYMNIDCNYYDALFLSAHKLLGGPSSCGILIIKKDLVDTTLSPTFAGGGTVEYVNSTIVEYKKDIIARETAGTPGILQFIRSALVYQLRNEIGFDFIFKRKEELLSYFLKGLKKITGIDIYGNEKCKNVGVVSFNIAGISPYEICNKLSQIKNIQTRAGCSCAGSYGCDLLGFNPEDKIKEKPSWLRVSIHYSQTKEEIDNLLSALHKITN